MPCHHAGSGASASPHPSLLPGASSPLPPGVPFPSADAHASTRRTHENRRVGCRLRSAFGPANPFRHAPDSFPLPICYFRRARFTKRARPAHTVFNGVRYTVSQQARGSPPPLASAYPLKQSDAEHRIIPSLGPGGSSPLPRAASFSGRANVRSPSRHASLAPTPRPAPQPALARATPQPASPQPKQRHGRKPPPDRQPSRSACAAARLPVW